MTAIIRYQQCTTYDRSKMLLFFPFALFIRFLSSSKALAKILKRKGGCKKIFPNSVNQVICAFLTKPSLRSIPANDVREKFLYNFSQIRTRLYILISVFLATIFIVCDSTNFSKPSFFPKIPIMHDY